MRTFFVLIFISFKLFASPIGNGKTIFSSDTKITIVKEFQGSSINIAFFDEEVNETEESEHDSTHTTAEKSDFYLHDFFTSSLTQNDSPNWVYSSQSYSYQQLYRLYSNFRI